MRSEKLLTGVLGRATRMLVAPYRAKNPPSRMVAVVVPTSSRKELLPEEELSIRQLRHVLARYDKYLIAPSGTETKREGFATVPVPRKFFGSAGAHTRLLMWPSFFRIFEDYEYVLIHHLDSLVLSDELTSWCQAG